nr:energy-coupled thiamine transporter ThiT [Virgibacillus pantothenticus]
MFIGSSLRFLAHYIAGVVFFESAVEGQPVCCIHLSTMLPIWYQRLS